MPNEVLKEAIKEAYQSAPTDIVILDTIEINHNNFTQPLRIINNNENINATLESTAPYNPNETVEFIRYSFEIILPPITENSTAHARITIDNVDTIIGHNIERASESTEKIDIIYRPYLSNDLSQPQYDPPLYMELSEISLNKYQVSGTMKFFNLPNESFPKNVYKLKDFYGLL